jgi:predicted CoA-binding protein
MNSDHTADLQTQAVAHILATCRTVAVVGLSPKAHRDSFRVSQYMQAQGWRLVPVNPVVAASGERILGERVYATVNVFRNSADVPPIVDEAIALKLPALWLQLGVKHDGAVAKARTAGMHVVQDRCLMVEHARSASQRG